MKKSSPRLFAPNYRLLVVCVVLTVLVGFGVSVSSHSGDNTSSGGQSAGAAQKANPAGIIASVFNFPMPLPSITATMTDQIVGDAGEIGKAGVGEKIRYTVTINNGGPDPATNLKLEDTIDPNTTLVGGSIVISPLAANETYQSVGNMTLTSSSIGVDCNANQLRSVTCNDTLRGATLTGFGDTQANANANAPGATLTLSGKGTVLLNADGTFVFNPVAGFEGNAEFWYTLTNSTITPALTDTGKVTITVGGANGLVWFVGSGGGNNNTFGTQSNPLSLAGFSSINNGVGSNPADNDAVFLFEGAHTGPVTLRNGQKFLGQDATVSANTLGAPAPQPGNAYPGNTGTAVSITSASNGINLASGNTLAGFTVGNVGANGTDTAVSGTVVGNLSVREVIINTNRQALIITTSGNAVSDATYTGFTSVTTTGGTNNISVVGLTGTLNLGGGALSGATGNAFEVGTAAASSGGGGSINYSGTISSANARPVSIRNKTGGTVSFSQAISSTNNGILLSTNPGATINFTGGITINITSNNGFSASGGGIINVTGTNNIDTTSGAALELNGVTVGSSGITFATVDKNANTGSTEAIDIDSLTSTGGGTLTIGSSTVAGNAVGSTLAGIDINGSSAGITLSTVTINDTDGAGIALTNNTGAISVSGGTVGATNDTTGNAVDIDQGNANVTIAAALTKNTANRIVEVSGRTGGTVEISGNLNCTSSCTGINVLNNISGTSTINFSASTKTLNTGTSAAVNLDNNDNATINFSNGGLNIDTTAGTGFSAVNGASGITVTTGANANTIDSTTGIALRVENSNIGSSGLNFQSINTNGASSGIVLTSTGTAAGNGGLTVTGTAAGSDRCGGTITNTNTPGTAATVNAKVDAECTGGTIQSTSSHGIILNNTKNFSVSRMRVVNPVGDGINVNNINGFTLTNSQITDSSGVAQDSAIQMGDFSTGTAVNGTITVTNSTLGQTPHDNFAVGIGSGTSSWNITGTLFDDSQLNSGFNFEIRNATVSSFNMSGCVLRNQFADGMQMQPASNVTTATITTSTIQNNTFIGNNLGLDLNHDGVANITYRVINNTFRTHQSHAINFFSSAVQAPTTGGTYNGRFEGNVIGASGSAGSGSATGNGIRVNINGGADSTVVLHNNLIRETPVARGIEVISRNGTGGLDVTASNNTVLHTNTAYCLPAESAPCAATFPLAAIFIQSNCVGVCNSLRADVRGNTVPAGVASDILSTFIIVAETSGAPSPAGTSTASLVDNAPTPSANATTELTEAHTNPAHNNTGSASAEADVGLISGPISTVAMNMLQMNERQQYFALDSSDNGYNSLLAFVNKNKDSNSFAALMSASAEVSTVGTELGTAETGASLSSGAHLHTAQAGTVLAYLRPEIEKGAFALAHADKKSQTLGSRVSSFISSIGNAVAPTAHAAAAPMPALEVNETLGTLPANKSVTVVFEVTVNGPHPYASYTNNATIKADSVPDTLKQVTTPGDRYNNTTALTVDPASPSFTGETVTFTATVTPSEAVGVVNPATGGFVQFKDNGVNIGGPVACTADGNNCKAQLATNSLTAATHPITAEYLGGTHHELSTSNTINYTVNACTPDPVVTTTADTTGGPNVSLRDAIIGACPGDNITFQTTSGGAFDPAGGPYTIQLLSALPDLDRDVTITGPGADVLEVRGKIGTVGDPTEYRVFNITSGVTVNILGLNISTGGAALTAGFGGGGVNNAGTLTLTEVMVKGNSSTSAGGGIQNTGTLTLERSTVSNNTSLLMGGGGIYNTGTMTIRNSTIASNTANAAGNGGGILNNSAGTTTVESSTIALNNANGSGGGIFNTAGTFNLANTIVGDNSASVANADLSGTFSSQDYNLFETTPAGFAAAAHDKTGNPLLQTILTDNGGPTLTLALLDGSPAIDAGLTTLTVDQRGTGFLREIDNPNVANATGGDASDIGAFESPAPPSAPDLTAASDLGALDTDNITSDTSPTFTIAGVSSGETVSLFRGTTFVIGGTATGATIDLTDPTAPEGVHTYTAKRTVGGGTSTSSLGLSVTIDTTDPATPTIDLTTDTGNSNSDNITNAATLSFDIGNTEAGATVELLRDGVTVSSTTTIAGGTVVLTDSPSAGSFTYTARQSDAAANSVDSAGLSVGVDRTGPSVSTITRVNASPTGSATVDYTVTFSENVTGVNTGDFAVTMSGVTGASVTNVTGASPGASYTVTVNTGSGDGTLRLDVADDDSIADVAGNPLGGAGDNGDFTSGEVYAVDKTDPVVSSIIRASANPTNAASVNFTVTFSEGVSGVDTTDFSLTTTGSIAGASVTSVTPVDSSHYTVAVNTGTGDGTIRLDITDNNSIIDQASKPLGGAGTQNFTTGEAYTVDKTAPTISIGSPSASASNGSGNVTYTVTYSDANFNTSTLAVGNITLNTTGSANATVAVDAGSGTTRTVTLSGITGNGTLGITIAANTASDTAGNMAPASAASATFVVDTVAPTVSAIVRANADPTSAASVNFTVTFSENVSGVDTADFALTTTGGISGASVTSVTPVTASQYTVVVNTGSGDGTLRLDVADNDTIVDQANTPLGGAGDNGDFTSGEVYTVDKTDPSVSSIVRADANPTDAASINFTVTFSENVSGVDTADFSLTTTGGIAGASITGVTGASPGASYTVTVSTGTGDGTIRLDITDNNSIVDQASKPLGGAGVQNFTGGEAYTIDKTAPTVDINRAAGQADTVTNASEINFTATFSEPVTGFDSSDVNLSGAGATTVTITEVAPNDDTTYNIKVTGMNTSGTVTVSINAGAAQDSLGHPSAASTHTDNTVEYTQDSSATFVVNSLANTTDGLCDPLGTGGGNQDCTLREAIELANLDAGAETITFAPALTAGGPQTILLNGAGTLPDITESVTITGPTNNRLTIDGNNNGRIFTIAAGQTVNISNLTVRNGNSPSHGGGIDNAGTLNLDNMLIEDNTATSSLGGGIFNNSAATLTITNSTIDDNTANGGHGGGVYNIGTVTIRNSTLSNNDAKTVMGVGGDGAAIDSDGGQLNVYNSTISGNRADGGGGGIHHCGTSAGSLVNVTITGNRSDMDDLSPGEGGGLEQVSTTAITLKNTIVAGNTKGNVTPVADDISVFGPGGIDLANSKNNLIGDAATSGGITHGGANGNIVGNSGAGTIAIGTVLDVTLANNGGPTLTHRLVSGSLAINAGNNTHASAVGLTTDQRGTGFTRFAGSSDIGAYEVQAGVGDHLAFQVQPANTNAGSTISVSVRILDALGDPTTSTANVTIAIGNNPGGGTLSGTTTVAAVNGTATFNDLSINNIGTGYTLVASSPGVVSATSNAFNIISPSSVTGTKTVSGTYIAGNNVTYTIVLTNNSSAAQLNNSGNEFADSLPPHLTLVSASATSGTAVATVGTNTVTWNGSIAGLSSVTITITATIKNGTNGSTVSNQGQFAYDADGNGTNEVVALTDDPGVAGANNPTIFVVNGAPTIAAVGVTRKAGDAGSNVTVANVNDVEDAENTLPVTVNDGSTATVNGVTVSGLSVSAGGVVTANVVAACGATNASFTLKVTDSKGLSNTATLNVTVNPNTAPTLTYPSPQAVNVGASLNINPATGPADSGSIGSITVLSQGTYTGTISVNNSTGVVSISNAAPAGSHTITIRATDNCGVNTDASFTLNVNKINQTITFNPLGDKTTTDADFPVSATASSGLTVSFAASGQCTVSGNTVHITGEGSCTITASQAGNSSYNAAPSVQRSFNISKANQTVTFNPLPNRTFGDADFAVNASASSGLSVTFSALGQCTVTGNMVHITGAGDCTITATQAGNATYNQASTQQGFSIGKAFTSTSIASSANPSAPGQNVTFTATVADGGATPNGSVQFKVDGVDAGAPVALNASGVATFSTSSLTIGTHSITADYSGNANFATNTGTLPGGQVVGIQTSLSVNDVSVTEGNSGTVDAVFTVTLSQSSAVPVTVDFATANGTATLADSDYQSATGTLTFNAGELTKTITVPVNGDTKNEPNETFFVNLTNAQNATVADNQGLGTVNNDDTPGVQLSNSSYNINEGANNTPQGFSSLTVDVIRTGDTSQPATVKYVTSDLSGGNECNQVTGQASQRCDYILVGATLRFAAGEASKSISIPVINDGYMEGAEFFSIQLQDGVGVTVGSPSQATITIQDDAADTTPTTSANNPYLSNTFFVRQNYLDFLGRDADQNGFTDWVNVLNNCGPQQGFLGAPFNCDRAHVSHGFFASDEFTKSGFLIYRLFEVGMNRLPLYREFIPDMATLSGFNLSPAQQQQNLQDYLQEFTSKQEFINRFQDVSQTSQAAQYIERLEQTAGLTLPDTATTLPGQPPQYGRNELIQKRASGQFSMGETLKAFVEQKPVYDLYFPSGHVTMLYFAYLRRDPSLNDPNLIGWTDWVDVFTNGKPSAGVQPRDIHHLIFGFIYSEEYRKRFGAP